MYISEISKIDNYRNMSNVAIKFDKTINYLIGENNIGKTNILELLHCIFGVGKFSVSDFDDLLKPINIEIKIKYNDDEYGFVENYFLLNSKKNEFTLIATQNNPDERISYNINTSKKNIKFTSVKKINILYYDAKHMPSKEIDFSKSSDSAKALNYLIKHSLDKHQITEKDVLKTTNLNRIVGDINKNIGQINSVTNDGIKAVVYNDIDRIVCRLLGLCDKGGRDLNELGDGIQYAFNILLHIIEIIHYVKETRDPNDYENVLINKNGKKYFPLLLILDEPEVHQHPYRQRKLIKNICEIMQNENDEFCLLLKELFDVDGITGQIFVATHSPNILLNDYKQFIRIYRSSNNDIRVISGSNIKLEEKVHKHMLRIFSELKETMFGRYVLLVEGDTENGAFPVFARKLNIDFDEKGIGLVKLNGADSVIYCMRLFEGFGIKAFAFLDGDKKSKYAHENQNIVFTDGKDIEEDIYDSFSLDDYMKYIVENYKKAQAISILKFNGIPFDSSSNGIVFNLTDSEKKELMIKIKNKELSKLKKNKNYLNGAILAEYVTKIPDSINRIFDELKKVV